MNIPKCSTCRRWKKEHWCITCNYEAKDLVEVVRCKDCVHYDPPHIINNGERIEYSDLPQEVFGVKEHYKAIGEFMNMITNSETIEIDDWIPISEPPKENGLHCKS